jgi:hypothetical protein
MDTKSADNTVAIVDDALPAQKSRARSLLERGMATAEYAVGIIAAVALALVMLKIFQADSFFTWIGKLITSIFNFIFGLIGG